jgi:hypothetical protein
MDSEKITDRKPYEWFEQDRGQWLIWTHHGTAQVTARDHDDYSDYDDEPQGPWIPAAATFDLLDDGGCEPAFLWEGEALPSLTAAMVCAATVLHESMRDALHRLRDATGITIEEDAPLIDTTTE